MLVQIIKVMELTHYWKMTKCSWLISLCSVCGTIHSSSQCSKHLTYMSFELWGFFFTETYITLSLGESALVGGQLSPSFHNSRYLVCTAHNDDLSKYPAQLTLFTCRFKLLSVWDWKQSNFMDFTSKRTIYTSFCISSFLTMGCRTPMFLSQP